MRWTLLLLVLLGGCPGPDGGEHPVRWLDPDGFTADVQPVLTARCGNPSCHGRLDRPYQVYAERGLRADPSDTWLDEPLTAAEVELNYTAACVFASEGAAPAEVLLLRKPLAEHAGTEHGGGAVFAGSDDRQWRTLHAWVEEGW
jgi:hypothetical protein